MSRGVALAHPNIALAKYWGKRGRPGNYPAVPSLSVTLSGMSTRTSVLLEGSLGADVLVLNGHEAHGEPLARTTELLDRLRVASGETRRARVESSNDFPTASGLASSASGFAALALAAAHAMNLSWDVARISDAARRSSASAARSLFGGFVHLGAGATEGPESDVLSARPVAPETQLDVRVLVCVTSEAEKDVSSRDGMNRTAKDSPYYAAWLTDAETVCAELERALLAKDLERVGALTERSTFAMHASAFAAGVRYMRAATLEVLDAVGSLRRGGLATWATMDAGPHVKVLVATPDAARARNSLASVPGVLRILETAPGPGARLVEGS